MRTDAAGLVEILRSFVRVEGDSKRITSLIAQLGSPQFEQREQATHDHTAASRLHGLLAYETRIEHVHEWPFDQLTLLRVASYVLIPASPALGQLAMRYFTHAA